MTPAARATAPFGDYFRDLMRAAGYERAHALARDTGVSHANIGRWLDGTASPSVDALRRIAPHVGVRLGDLMVHAGLATREELGMIGGAPAPGPALPAVIRSILSRLANPRFKQRHKDVLLAFIQDDVDRWDNMMDAIEVERAEARRERR